jgi:aminopeptidase N
MRPDPVSRTTGRATLATGLVLALALVPACASEPLPMPIEEGVPWWLAEQRAATVSDVRYRYHLRVPSERSVPLFGAVDIELRWSDPVRRDLVVDFQEPGARVRAVSVNDAESAWRAEYDHLVVPATSLTPDGVNIVRLEFEVGDGALNRNDEFLYTLFVPDRAHFSLPLFDQPNLKARFSLTLDIPSDWVAVSNGARRDGVDADASGPAPGEIRWEFAETAPLPTYLFAFAVGAFQVEEAELDGRQMRMLHRETDEEKVARNRDAVFDLHASALAWLEDYTGIDYPFEKFDFALIPPFQYGGMEHPGAIFYREGSLFLDESATQSQILSRASLIAHETAHMWFGDLVTMNWFDDVWTKEVFANFMAAKIVHPTFPHIRHDLRFFLAHHDTAYGVDRTAGANSIRQPLDNLNEAGALYGPIIYQKAPIVMRHLEQLLGETVLRDGLREYLDRFRYGNAAWTQLVELLDRRTELDLAAWSRVWVDEPGRPRIEVQGLGAGTDVPTQVEVVQVDPAEDGRVWPQELLLLAGYDDGFERIPVRLDAPRVEVDALAGRPRPRFLLPNGAGLEYGWFRLDQDSREYLLGNLPALDEPLVRGVGWANLWEAVLAGDVEPEVWLALLLTGLEVEPVEQNTQRLLTYLRTTYWRLMDRAGRDRWADALERTLWAGVTAGTAPTIQAAYFGAWRRLSTSPAAVGRMRRIWAGEEEVPGVPLAEPDFIALAEDLAVREVEDAAAILDRQEARIENPDRLARFRFIRPALAANPETRAGFFESLRDPANREREPWVLSGLDHLHHPTRAEHARRFILPALELLEEIQQTGDIFFPAGWVGATLRGHRSPEAAATVRKFLDSRPFYPVRLRQKILQSADLLYRVADAQSP